MTKDVTSQCLADGVCFEGVEGPSVVVGVVACVGSAVGEDVVFVGFLGVGIGTDLKCAVVKNECDK